MITYRCATLLDVKDVFKLYYEFKTLHERLHKKRMLRFSIQESIIFVRYIIESRHYNVVLAEKNGSIIGIAYVKVLYRHRCKVCIGKCVWVSNMKEIVVEGSDIVLNLIRKVYTGRVNISSEICDSDINLQKTYESLGFKILKKGKFFRRYIKGRA